MLVPDEKVLVYFCKIFAARVFLLAFGLDHRITEPHLSNRSFVIPNSKFILTCAHTYNPHTHAFDGLIYF